MNFNSAYVILDLRGFPIAQVWLPYNKVGNTKVLYIVNAVCFCTWESSKVLLIILIFTSNLKFAGPCIVVITEE